MKTKLMYLLVASNCVLLLIIGTHWRFISMKYTWKYTPPLSCDILRIAYTQRFESDFKDVDTYFAAHPDGQNMTDEVRTKLKQMESVQERGMQIEEICRQ